MWRISLAIVIGCATIAAAIYFGLRARAPTAPPPPALAADRDVQRALAMQAAAQLELQRARITAACPLPAGALARYDLQVAIGADGREVGRSLLELRNAPSPVDTAACVRALALPPFALAAPGAPLTLTIPLVLP